MVYNREDAARRAEKARTNTPGTCQLWTRTIFGVESAGDRDRDGDADAVDGWLSEPKAHRHPGDRNPPRGVPVSFDGGSRGFGHRAVSLGKGRIRSTDMTAGGYLAGNVGTTTIEQIERSMGVRYLGWSNTITGHVIPLPPPVPKTRGRRIDKALRKLKKAEKKALEGTRRDTLLDRAIKNLKKIKRRPKRR